MGMKKEWHNKMTAVLTDFPTPKPTELTISLLATNKLITPIRIFKIILKIATTGTGLPPLRFHTEWTPTYHTLYQPP